MYAPGYLREPIKLQWFKNEKHGWLAVVAINRKIQNDNLPQVFSSLGGIRVFPYLDINAMIRDVCLLAEAMTKKALGANLNIGGAKMVVMGDPKTIKTGEFLLWIGECINSLNGGYYGAEDMGMKSKDIDIVSTVTEWITGRSIGNGGSGDPGEVTAYGVLSGVEIAAAFHPATRGKRLNELSCAIQGLGGVGKPLAKMLLSKGCSLIVTDIDRARCANFEHRPNVTVVEPGAIHATHVDVFAPCACGGVINNKMAREFNCHIIAGSANNQLEQSSAGVHLWEARHILYAPDSIINAGGLISVMFELEREIYSRERACARAEKIVQENLAFIFEQTYRTSVPPEIVFEEMVQERYEQRVRNGTIIVS